MCKISSAAEAIWTETILMVEESQIVSVRMYLTSQAGSMKNET
jgi:hypothetical protein